MIKLYSYSHDWFAWRPVRLGFIGKGAVVWLNPNQFTCKWCPYGPDRQGDCKYGVSANAAPLVNKPSATDALF